MRLKLNYQRFKKLPRDLKQVLGQDIGHYWYTDYIKTETKVAKNGESSVVKIVYNKDIAGSRLLVIKEGILLKIL